MKRTVTLHCKAKKKTRIRKACDRLLAAFGLGERIIIQINYLAGKNKRVAIARAFMNNPDLILADEPTASLTQNAHVKLLK